MNFREKFLSVLQALKITKRDNFTKEDWDAIDAEFKKQYGMTLTEALAKNQESEDLAEDRKQALEIINSAVDTGEKEEDPENSSLAAGVQQLVDSNRKLSDQIAALAAKASADIPSQTVTRQLTVAGPGTTATHLFGIESDVFSMIDRPWNQVAANPLIAGTVSFLEKENVFRSDLSRYAAGLAKRYSYLKNQKLTDTEKMAAGKFASDYSGLKDAGLGEQYVVFRQDALIAHVLELEDTSVFYPRRYGVQDRELMTSAFFESVSQAYQSDKVFKGGMSLQPEWGHVDDAMFETMFPDMKWIERQYIGYLNMDGSDPIKWSMIEFILLQLYKVAMTEQNVRRIFGIHVKPETGKPGHYLNASTGVFYTLIRYVHEHKLLPTSDDTYNDYSKENMLEMVLEFLSDIKENLSIFENLNGKVIQLNEKHKDWWISNLRKKYGKDNDFVGIYIDRVPDMNIPIQWVPFGHLKLMLVQSPGNIMSLEYEPGEMFAIRMIENLKSVEVGSYWKEGVSATFVGKHFNSREELEANKYEHQAIFMNWPSIKIEKDATTIDGSKGLIYITQENTDSSKKITDIKNASPGFAYVIECGSSKNHTSIDKSGKFANITDGYVPQKAGDYIMVTLNQESNGFIELERCVNCARTINKAKQPTIPGAR